MSSVEQALRRARQFTKQGNFEKAFTTYQKVLDVFPNNLSAKRGLTNLQEKSASFHSVPITLNERQELLDLFNNKKFQCIILKAEKLLEKQPQDINILNMLGVAAFEVGNLKKARLAFEKLTKLDSNNPTIFGNLGKIAKKEKAFCKSIQLYEKALKLDPVHLDTWYNLGIAFHANKDFQEAINAFHKVTLLSPGYVEAYISLGNSLREKGLLTQAIATHTKAVNLGTTLPDAFFQLGVSLQMNGEINKSIDAHSKAITLNPRMPEPYYFCGLAFQKIDETKEAIRAYKSAIDLEPDYSEAYCALADSYKQLESYSDAIQNYKKAINIKPNYPEAYNNLGLAYVAICENRQAVSAFKTATLLDPTLAEAQNNLGRAYIASQQFKKGFDLFEWRWKTSQNLAKSGGKTKIGKEFDEDIPKWQGEPVEALYIWAEQGIGDEVMYASLIPEVAQLSTKVTLECDPRLMPIFKRSLPKNVKYHPRNLPRTAKHHDAHISIASLPSMLRPTLDSFIKARKPYLFAHSSEASRIRQNILGSQKTKMIGLSWNTESRGPSSQHRNIQLSEIASHFKNIDAVFVSLQYGDISNELETVKNSGLIDIRDIPEIDKKLDICGLASLILACHTVVTIDNSTAHLSGAVGAQTKLLLPKIHDCRWGINQKTTVWYDSVELFHKPSTDDWGTTLAEVRSKIS